MKHLAIALTFLGLTALMVVVAPLVEARQRSPEAVARAYLRSIEQGDLDAALATIEPAVRTAVRERVALQIHNRYAIQTVVVGRPSAWDRLTNLPLPPAWVTVSAEVTTLAGERWRSASTVMLVEQDGVWYLTGPLFA